MAEKGRTGPGSHDAWHCKGFAFRRTSREAACDLAASRVRGTPRLLMRMRSAMSRLQAGLRNSQLRHYTPTHVLLMQMRSAMSRRQGDKQQSSSGTSAECAAHG